MAVQHVSHPQVESKKKKERIIFLTQFCCLNFRFNDCSIPEDTSGAAEEEVISSSAGLAASSQVKNGGEGNAAAASSGSASSSNGAGAVKKEGLLAGSWENDPVLALMKKMQV